MKRILLPFMAILVFASLAAPRHVQAETADTVEPGFDRPGGDISSFDVQPRANSLLTAENQCKGACKSNASCKAWTLVKPGVQGPRAKCYLKNVISAGRKDACCTSGVLAASVCEPGKVYRDSFDGDGLCVLPDERWRLANGGCREGYVKLGIAPRQNVCVTPKMRADAIKADYAKVDNDLLSDDPQDFQGEWAMKTGQGSASTLQLTVSGNSASGSFRVTGQSAFNGTLTGTIKHFDKDGGQFVRLSYNSKQPQTDGHGTFKVYKDGRLDGGFTWKPPGAVREQYTRWTGRLIGRDFNIDYGGCPGCGSDTSSGSGAVPAEWADMLAAHNEKRQQHCVPPLKWSPTLASAAQAYAEKCMLGQHGSSGENLATAAYFSIDSAGVKTARIPATSDRTAFNDAWYCEAKFYNYQSPKVCGGFKGKCDEVKPECGTPVTGHFTQVVWKDTTQLGCGRATCTMNGEKGTNWVCRYSPFGNVNTNDPNVLNQQVKNPAACK